MRPVHHSEFDKARCAIRVAGPEDVLWVSTILGQDAQPVMSRAVTLLSEHGGFFLEPLTSSVFEAHMFFLPQGRGREALHAARHGIRHMFEVEGAKVIFGRIPFNDIAARRFTRLIGLRSDGVRGQHPGGPLVEYFEIRSDEMDRLGGVA